MTKAGGQYRQACIEIHAFMSHLHQCVYGIRMAQVMHTWTHVVTFMRYSTYFKQLTHVIYTACLNLCAVCFDEKKTLACAHSLDWHPVAMCQINIKHILHRFTKRYYTLASILGLAYMDVASIHMYIFVPDG